MRVRHYRSIKRLRPTFVGGFGHLDKTRVSRGWTTRETKRTLPGKEAFMFNTLYLCSRTIARHENGPLAESRASVSAAGTTGGRNVNHFVELPIDPLFPLTVE